MNYKELFLPACSAAGPVAFRAPSLSRGDASECIHPFTNLEEGHDHYLLNTLRP